MIATAEDEGIFTVPIGDAETAESNIVRAASGET
jgi:hypothetical protein